MHAFYCILVVLFSSVIFSSSQSVNPSGTDFFDPANVFELTIDSPAVSRTVQNQTSDYFFVSIPNNVLKVNLELNATNYGTGSCQSYITLYANWEDNLDFAEFPCQSATFCSYQKGWTNTNFKRYVLDTPNIGSIYFAVVSPGSTCSYTFAVTTNATCDTSSAPLVSSNSLICYPKTSVQTSGSKFTYNYTVGQYKLFEVNVPQNTSVITVTVTSTVDSWINGINAESEYGVVPQNGFDSSSYNASTGLYTFQSSIAHPIWGHNYISIGNTVNGSFQITFEWVTCTTGNGYQDGGPQCFDKLTNVDIKSSLPATFTFTNFTWSGSSNVFYNGIYTYLSVPEGTYGYVYITCNTTDPAKSTWLAFNNDYTSIDCNGNYIGDIYCDTNDTIAIFSQQLYVGQAFQFGICTHSSFTFTANINLSGNITLPTPVPTASPTSSSSSGADRMQITMAVLLLALIVVMS